jgi:hypothetical protein
MSWASFITGAATKATELINDRDKEIQKKIDEQLSLMNEEAKTTKKKGETRRDALKSAANQLVSFGMNPDQVAAFISGADPATLEASIKLLQSRAVSPGGITPQMTEQMVRSLPKVQETPEQVIEKLSTPVAGAAPDFGTMRGAFGLPSGAAKEAQERAAKLRTELPELPSAAGPLDLTVFAEAKSFDKRKDDAQTALLDAKTPKERQLAMDNLVSIMQIEALGKREGPTESDVRSNFRILDTTIKNSMAGPGDLVIDKETNTYLYSRSIKPEVRAKIEQARLDGFKNLAQAYMQPDGSVPENVARVLMAFGVKVDRQGRPQFEASAAPPSRGGREGAPEAPAPVAPTPAAAPAADASQLPRPTTQEEYDAIPSGTDYIDTDGKRKTKAK